LENLSPDVRQFREENHEFMEDIEENLCEDLPDEKSEGPSPNIKVRDINSRRTPRISESLSKAEFRSNTSGF
jgi:hypothetical protein